MAPPFAIQSVWNVGPTDNHGDDTLHVVEIVESGRTEQLRFSVARSQGEPTAHELAQLVISRARGFASDRPASVQFREREVEHPEGSQRRVVFLSLPPE